MDLDVLRKAHALIAAEGSSFSRFAATSVRLEGHVALTVNSDDRCFDDLASSPAWGSADPATDPDDWWGWTRQATPDNSATSR